MRHEGGMHRLFEVGLCVSAISEQSAAQSNIHPSQYHYRGNDLYYNLHITVKNRGWR